MPRRPAPAPLLAPPLSQKKQLEALAATDFDPDDYKNASKTPVCNWCRICGCRYAPGAVCGYCRYAVRAIRAKAAKAKTSGVESEVAPLPFLKCWDTPEAGPEDSDMACLLPSGHDGGHLYTTVKGADQ